MASLHLIAASLSLVLVEGLSGPKSVTVAQNNTGLGCVVSALEGGVGRGRPHRDRGMGSSRGPVDSKIL